MSGVSQQKRPPATLLQQAELISYLADCCERNGKPMDQTWLNIGKYEAEDLRALAHRLKRMAPYENEIRKLVVGR